MLASAWSGASSGRNGRETSNRRQMRLTPGHGEDRIGLSSIAAQASLWRSYEAGGANKRDPAILYVRIRADK
jgi:hypothetical protein